MLTVAACAVKVGVPAAAVQVTETVTGVSRLAPITLKAAPASSATWKVLAGVGLTAAVPFACALAQESGVATSPHGHEKRVVFDSVIWAGPVTVAVKEPGPIVFGVASLSCITTPQSVTGKRLVGLSTARLSEPGAMPAADRPLVSCPPPVRFPVALTGNWMSVFSVELAQPTMPAVGVPTVAVPAIVNGSQAAVEAPTDELPL